MRLRRQSGDTIIEVLIALAVFGLAFGLAYGTANRSLTLARNAEEHSEALQYLDSQVELARADAADNTLYNMTGTTYCMDQYHTDANYGKPIATSSPLCNVGNLYTVSYTYSNDQINGVCQNLFTFVVNWQGLGNLGQQQEHMAYKIHNLSGSINGCH